MVKKITEMALVYTTIADVEAAKALARTLVESKAAECVNIIPGVFSIYRWEGEITEENEVSLCIKAKPNMIPMVKEVLVKYHPYQEIHIAEANHLAK